MIQLRRTNSNDIHFLRMVDLLNADLAERDGEETTFYSRYNGLDTIRHAVVAYLDEEPVGCGAFKPYGEGVAEIKRMYVVPEQRGKGIAGAVLKALEDWAGEEGYDTCLLETGKRQPEAIRLYQKAGYVRVPNYGQYAGVENSVCMRKGLRFEV